MSTKLGLLLSLFFTVILMAYAADFTSIQMIHSSLENYATTIGKELSLRGPNNYDPVSYLSSLDITYTAITTRAVKVGDVYAFALSKTYSPMALSQEPLIIKVQRSTIISALM